ncbi:hypothetical protein L218DRAFT_188078 [Marasmius fiardii PR-910]|nr:hypothetical protein L218DRAFT_188078 [Marasmius fiardii PR-910]
MFMMLDVCRTGCSALNVQRQHANEVAQKSWESVAQDSFQLPAAGRASLHRRRYEGVLTMLIDK